ncbi:MAG: hypothetical protein O2992_03335 [Gemmatimonadetes bacterium]|nr:hypothetical protein [Gemmatimonadota bacterium]
MNKPIRGYELHVGLGGNGRFRRVRNFACAPSDQDAVHLIAGGEAQLLSENEVGLEFRISLALTGCRQRDCCEKD